MTTTTNEYIGFTAAKMTDGDQDLIIADLTENGEAFIVSMPGSATAHTRLDCRAFLQCT